MNHSIFLFLSLFLLVSSSCGMGGNNVSQSDANAIAVEMKYADYLTVAALDDGCFTVTIRNPWDTVKTLHTYTLVPDTIDSPANPAKGTVVKIPLKNALVYSSVHQSLLRELGVTDAIGGVCDTQYISDTTLIERISDGRVADCGNSYTPNIEKIIALNPDGIMLSPYENSGSYGKIGTMDIPLIECGDYMESSPLGRMEWVKFYGLLFGRKEKADEMFSSVEREYNRLKEMTASVATRRRVVIDGIYGNIWYVPTASSTMGIFIEDAGGENPFASNGRNGSVGLSGEQVLHQAGDADCWLIRYSQASDKTLKELSGDNPIYGQFTALKNGEVYGCNLNNIPFFEEVPFHPDLFLRDMIKVLHPEIDGLDGESRYFSRLQP